MRADGHAWSMAHLVSVNIGKPELVPGHRAPTGIVKRPAEAPVMIGYGGVEGDAVLDGRYHGGPDQAVYIYLAGDYDFWERELGYRPEPGMFGENLTIAGVDGADLAVGDRFYIGPVGLEVTAHRSPCGTFAARMGDPAWVKRFFSAGRPGAYARVLLEGEVQAGDSVSYEPFGGPRVLVSDLLALDIAREPDPGMLRTILTAPIGSRLRSDVEKKLAKAG
jgi:MOSC domain-containing protein YiiM